MKRTRNLVIIAVVLAAIVLAVALTSRHGKPALAVSVTTVKRAPFTVKLAETGVVAHPLVETIPTLVAGNLQHVYVKAGDRVAAGELLATIQNATLESTAAGSQADYDSARANIQTARINEQNARVTYVAAVETAKSNLEEARRIYEADVALYKNKAIPRNQVDTDRAKLDQSQVQYDQAVRQLKLGAVTGYGQDSVQYAQAAAQKAQILNTANQQQLSFTRIVAPFSGVIQTAASQTDDPLTPLHAGDAVGQGQMLFTIAQDSDYVVKAQVDEQDIIGVHPGQQANITGEDFPGKTLVGHVALLSPVASKSSDPSSTARQVVTTVRLDRSPPFLRAGMTVDVDILTTNIPKTLLVPTSAIGKDGKRTYVYVLRGNKAAKTYVRTGTANDTQTSIASGLAPGDRVVTAANDPLLHDGSEITVLPSPSASPAA